MKKTRNLKFIVPAFLATLVLAFAGCNNGASLDEDTDTEATQSPKKESPAEEKPAGKTPESTYTITISDNITHGTVSVSKNSGIKADETVTLTITADTDYELDTLLVKDASDNSVTTTDNTFKMPAGNVTVSATFKWKYPYFGNKAATEAKEVGDIVFNDGSAIAYSRELVLTDEQKAAAIAIIFYVGTGSATTGSNENILGEKTLGVGLNTAYGLKWAPDGTTGYNTQFTGIEYYISETEPTEGIYYTTRDYGSTTYSNRYLTGDFDGSDNWDFICSEDSEGSADAETYYPAFNWVNNYGENYSIPENYKNDWYLPAALELLILRTNVSIVNDAISVTGATEFNGVFFSSNQCARQNKVQGQIDNPNKYAEYIYVSETSSTYNIHYCFKRWEKNYTCAVRTF